MITINDKQVVLEFENSFKAKYFKEWWEKNQKSFYAQSEMRHDSMTRILQLIVDDIKSDDGIMLAALIAKRDRDE